MTFYILTIFPEFFAPFLEKGIIAKGIEKGKIKVIVKNLRDFTHDKRRTVDDYSFGGGGMVLKPEPIFEAMDRINEEIGNEKKRVILLTPQGKLFTQRLAEELSREKFLVLICGRYEGVDERVREHLVTDEISIGDYILAGGEIPALVILESVSRIIPGVLGKEKSFEEDSFTQPFLDWPHYTRPRVYRNFSVPQILLSGNHEAVKKWRLREALKRTLERRPDLLKEEYLDPEALEILKEIKGGKNESN
ncbi:tRNA (guanosine(37)-N1)-methyltransferase TrmD [Candidatus Calescamantes bacterium]|nr:tRNA (guanosine(37)-N1)-methyltransferase TrmD [Candidatus Calescamantes bacterium]